MFWMMGSNSRKEKKKKNEMLSALKKDAKVKTIGGLLGTVEEVMDNEVKIIVDTRNKVTLTFDKSAISNVISS